MKTKFKFYILIAGIAIISTITIIAILPSRANYNKMDITKDFTCDICQIALSEYLLNPPEEESSLSATEGVMGFSSVEDLLEYVNSNDIQSDDESVFITANKTKDEIIIILKELTPWRCDACTSDFAEIYVK